MRTVTTSSIWHRPSQNHSFEKSTAATMMHKSLVTLKAEPVLADFIDLDLDGAGAGASSFFFTECLFFFFEFWFPFDE